MPAILCIFYLDESYNKNTGALLAVSFWIDDVFVIVIKNHFSFIQIFLFYAICEQMQVIQLAPH